MFNKIGIYALAMAISAFATSARAEDCTLKLAASLPITLQADGTVTVPVEVAGKEFRFSLDISSGVSVITAKASAALNLPTSRLPRQLHLEDKNRETGTTNDMNNVTTLPDIHIGNVAGHGVRIRIRILDTKDNIDADGSLALDLLRDFDFELDLRSAKFNIFSQDHCAGKVVYWADSYGVVSLVRDRVGNLHSYATLDGKSVIATMSLSEPRSFMMLRNAGLMFGIKKTDATLKRTDVGWAIPTYNYPFDSLSIGDVTVLHPQILLYDQPEEPICDGMLQLSLFGACGGEGDVVLGYAEMKNLHIFFAMREGKAYVTAADAHK